MPCARDKSELMAQAYDINAACSGYLYALQAGYDYLQSTPLGRVLVVTAEVLSPLLDPEDFDTAILFGDATSATVLYGEAHFDKAKARLYRPELSAKGEDGSTLSVPLLHDGYIQMKGRQVFSEAVRLMVASLNRVCDREGLRVAGPEPGRPASGQPADYRRDPKPHRRPRVQQHPQVRQHVVDQHSALPVRRAADDQEGRSAGPVRLRRRLHLRGLHPAVQLVPLPVPGFRDCRRRPAGSGPPGCAAVRDGMALFAAPDGVPVVFGHEGVCQVVGDLADRPSS